MLDLGRTFLQSVERRPQRLAVVDGEVRLSYAEWFERIRSVAGALAELELQPGDHLAVVLQNRWEMARLHWACQFLGVIVTPLNWRAKADELDYCVADANARAIVFEPVSAEAVLGAPPAPMRRATAEYFSLILYPSGTTGRPKGVPRRHRAERAAALAHVAQN